MTYELTKGGLFSYFDRIEVATIIELPLIKRNLSAHEDSLCRMALTNKRRSSVSSATDDAPIEQAILDFEALRQASLVEVVAYFRIDRVRELYSQTHGEYFDFFLTNVLAQKESPHKKCGDLFLVIDEITEKKLILAIQSAMALPLAAFNNTLLEQDVLLKEIATEFKHQSTKAQAFITTVQKRDIRYKQMVVNLAFSFLKLGLSPVAGAELVSVSQNLAELASIGFGAGEAQFSNLVTKIQDLVANTNIGVLKNAEDELLSTTLPADVELGWSRYIAQVFHRANEAIRQVLDQCVNNDMFYRCIIKEVLQHNKRVKNDRLLILATESAKKYVADIVSSLQAQVAKIRRVRNAVVSQEGGERVELYFRQLCLINYAKHHQNDRGGVINGWLTGRTGRLLHHHFSEEVFQEKHAPVRLLGLFHHQVKYCGRRITSKEYQDEKQKARLVLSAVRNPPGVVQGLIANLEALIPKLGDSLIEDLQRLRVNTVPQLSLLPKDAYDTVARRGSCTFTQRGRVFFDLTAEDTAHAPEPPQPAPGTPILIAHRRTSSDS